MSQDVRGRPRDARARLRTGLVSRLRERIFGLRPPVEVTQAERSFDLAQSRRAEGGCSSWSSCSWRTWSDSPDRRSDALCPRHVRMFAVM
jgi:hypothetical protein